MLRHLVVAFVALCCSSCFSPVGDPGASDASRDPSLTGRIDAGAPVAVDAGMGAECLAAGGVCELVTPGSCLKLVAGDSTIYPCPPAQICCLPSPCVRAGGQCVDGATSCPGGHIGSPASYACGYGAPGACCLSDAKDAGICVPKSCGELGFNCGTAVDGCGKPLDCGVCSYCGQTCGGGGVPNVCGGALCCPKACKDIGWVCGQVGDGCGGLLNCGTCPASQTCDNTGHCVATDCMPNQTECGSVCCDPGQSCIDHACCSMPCDGCCCGLGEMCIGGVCTGDCAAGGVRCCGPGTGNCSGPCICCPGGSTCQDGQCFMPDPCNNMCMGSTPVCDPATATCRCIATSCFPDQTCSSTGQCVGGTPDAGCDSFLDHGHCFKHSPTCVKDSDCSTSYSGCLNGHCIKGGCDCISSADCAPGAICITNEEVCGECAASRPVCNVSSDCAAGQECTADGYCAGPCCNNGQ